MQETAQKCPGSDDDRSSGDRQAEIAFHAHYIRVLYDHARNRSLHQIEIFRPFQNRFDPKLVRLFVTLRSRSPNRWTLTSIEHPKLNSRCVGIEAHSPAHGVDLPNNVPFG